MKKVRMRTTNRVLCWEITFDFYMTLILMKKIQLIAINLAWEIILFCVYMANDNDDCFSPYFCVFSRYSLSNKMKDNIKVRRITKTTITLLRSLFKFKSFDFHFPFAWFFVSSCCCLLYKQKLASKTLKNSIKIYDKQATK